MKKSIMILLLSGLILLPLLAQEVIREYKIPIGWKFHRYYSRAIYLLPDLPDEQLAKGDVPRRLLIFDRQDNLISDLTLDPWWWFSALIGEKILLSQADENGTYFIKLIDLNGKEIYRLNTNERWVAQVIGKYILLEPLKEHGQIGPISIIDGETGKEKFRFEPFQRPDGPSMPDCFLLTDDGFYVVGRGATLLLKSYYEPDKTFWQIMDIGGIIKDAFILNKDLIAVGYGLDDFKNGVFMRGAAVIEWRTGKILFNKYATRARKGEKWLENDWFNSFSHLLLSIGDEGELIIGENEDGGTMLPPKSGKGGWQDGWDEKRARKIKYLPTTQEIYSSDGKKAKVEIRGRTVIKDFGTFVRIERRTYTVDAGEGG